MGDTQANSIGDIKKLPKLFEVVILSIEVAQVSPVFITWLR